MYPHLNLFIVSAQLSSAHCLLSYQDSSSGISLCNEAVMHARYDPIDPNKDDDSSHENYFPQVEVMGLSQHNKMGELWSMITLCSLTVCLACLRPTPGMEGR